MVDYHVGVMCNNCSKENFYGMRYKCLRCDDYDLCTPCYNLKVHDENHPMQYILVPYGRFNLTLTCPYCSADNFTDVTLHAHVYEQHKKETDTKILCPLCIINPYCHPNFMHTNLAKHLVLAHLVGCSQKVSPIPFALHDAMSGSEDRFPASVVEPGMQNVPEFLQELQDLVQGAAEGSSESSS